MVAFLPALLLSVTLQAGTLPELVDVVPPAAPLDVVGGATVVIEGEIDGGGRVRSLGVVQGAAPFSGLLSDAVGRWRFESAGGSQADRVPFSVTVLFRPRTLLASGPPSQILTPTSVLGSERPPFPLSLADPGYPATSLAEGVVIFRLEVGAEGRIERLRIVEGIPGLTGLAEDAVRAMTFEPARREGEAVRGLAFVAVSFLRPVVDSGP